MKQPGRRPSIAAVLHEGLFGSVDALYLLTRVMRAAVLFAYSYIKPYGWGDVKKEFGTSHTTGVLFCIRMHTGITRKGPVLMQ